jgi:hypothetical protein
MAPPTAPTGGRSRGPARAAAAAFRRPRPRRGRPPRAGGAPPAPGRPGWPGPRRRPGRPSGQRAARRRGPGRRDRPSAMARGPRRRRADGCGSPGRGGRRQQQSASPRWSPGPSPTPLVRSPAGAGSASKRPAPRRPRTWGAAHGPGQSCGQGRPVTGPCGSMAAFWRSLRPASIELMCCPVVGSFGPRRRCWSGRRRGRWGRPWPGLGPRPAYPDQPTAPRPAGRRRNEYRRYSNGRGPGPEARCGPVRRRRSRLGPAAHPDASSFDKRMALGRSPGSAGSHLGPRDPSRPRTRNDACLVTGPTAPAPRSPRGPPDVTCAPPVRRAGPRAPLSADGPATGTSTRPSGAGPARDSGIHSVWDWSP